MQAVKEKHNLSSELTCSLFTLEEINPLIGMRMTMMNTPASALAPSSCHRKKMATMMVSGADHMMCMIRAPPCTLSASTDMRFTISPIVVSFREALDNLMLCISERKDKN